MFKKEKKSQAWSYVIAIPSLRRLRQVDGGSLASLPSLVVKLKANKSQTNKKPRAKGMTPEVAHICTHMNMHTRVHSRTHGVKQANTSNREHIWGQRLQNEKGGQMIKESESHIESEPCSGRSLPQTSLHLCHLRAPGH